MSRRDMRNYSKYREVPFKSENEPEEGEIVDEFDLIVSSDEELSMRQRIRELEAENDEIEQIAAISRSYVDKIDTLHTHLENSRAARVPTDASSISSTEFFTPKKRKLRKSRDHKRKYWHHQHYHQYEQHLRYHQQHIPLKTRSKKWHCKRRQQLLAKKHKKVHSDRYTYKEINAGSAAVDSPESSDSTSSLSDTDYYSKNWLPIERKEDEFEYGKYISRDTLRLAVARNSKESKTSCLKDKLLRQDLVAPLSIPALDKGHSDRKVYEIREENDDDEDDDDVQVIENEPEIQTVDEDSTDSMEEKELRLIALKSAVLKKHMARKMRNAEAAYSPTDFDEMLSSGVLRQDSKLDDIDLVDLEAEDSQNAFGTVSPVASPQLMILEDQEESQQMVDCKPIDMDIANSDSGDTTIDSWSKETEPSLPTFSLIPQDFANHYKYSFYMPELHELPPPPPGVDDYEDVPPLPPCQKIYNTEMQDMDLDNEELPDEQHWLKSNVNSPAETKQTDQDGASALPVKVCDKEDIDVEEEEALRALLLSKLHSPKNQKKIKRQNDLNECQDHNIHNELNAHTSNTLTKPTEFILKEAVKRLKIHSQTEESSVDFQNQHNENLSTKSFQRIKNNNDSLSVLEKLRNRLNKYKNQTPIKFEGDSNDVCSKDNEEESELTAGTSIIINDVIDNQYHETSLSNTPDLVNKIDISDITRRLQQIKENVLNAANRQSHQESITNLDFDSNLQVNEVSQKHDYKDTQSVLNNMQEPIENISDHHKPLNNVDNVDVAKEEIQNILIKDKTVEANFDASTNQTTFKVIITNTYEKNINQSFPDVSCKEKANNGTKNIKLKVNVNSINKTERLVKVITKRKEINNEQKPQVVKSPVVIKPTVTNAQVTSAPSYSSLRITKIVKPNKVINANFDLNRRQASLTTDFTSSKSEPIKQLSNTTATDNSRLITSIDQVKHMCTVAPFVISVQNSSCESSGNELGGDCDSFYKPLYDYNDNASPLSLNLESPSRTPLRSNSPTDSVLEVNTKIKALHSKLDAFLKESETSANPQNNESDLAEKINKTPLAVRHLPAAAQSEYRKLVHRMKLLENKRKSATDQKESVNTKMIDCSVITAEGSIKDKDINNLPKTSLVKKVLIRNANSNTTTSAKETKNPNVSQTTSKCHKTNILRSYENLFAKVGAGIVNNLDKSLKLVEEAKRAKMSKLKLESRLKELKAEMDQLQSKHKEEQQKISHIYPSICTTNEVITSLKQKRAKVFKAALNLGKTVKGEDYRLNNDLKESITAKSKQLAMEIKMVNSLKAQDITNMEKSLKPSNPTIRPLKVPEENKEIINDSTGRSNRENIMKKSKEIAAVVCSENDKEMDKDDDGGNTEFQNLNTSKSPLKPLEPCPPEIETKPKYLDANNDSIKEAVNLPSYISPLEHLRNIDSNVDPNGVVCPYDLMGNCEDGSCKYVHIPPKTKT